MDYLLKIILDSEIGNRTNKIRITQYQYDELKKDFKLSNFNIFCGPFGPVEIEVI